ncbi:hypothetical protein HYH03_005259 [Edaphochlamys debaryana]|uniref:SRCR domain-containing protein n=1 Tax=Edaphochlamys debaryana TaxID=47281 RepID=A0A836C1F5_9CHLO|nr:hypothetical protein HYH03_005259 [Edaphochlamys debaryana]|eukprot:KAG2496856.1 hypothetical protein HYH03_005259 [Edaphochlamys debaryana]
MTFDAQPIGPLSDSAFSGVDFGSLRLTFGTNSSDRIGLNVSAAPAARSEVVGCREGWQSLEGASANAQRCTKLLRVPKGLWLRWVAPQADFVSAEVLYRLASFNFTPPSNLLPYNASNNLTVCGAPTTRCYSSDDATGALITSVLEENDARNSTCLGETDGFHPGANATTLGVLNYTYDGFATWTIVGSKCRTYADTQSVKIDGFYLDANNAYEWLIERITYTLAYPDPPSPPSPPPPPRPPRPPTAMRPLNYTPVEGDIELAPYDSKFYTSPQHEGILQVFAGARGWVSVCPSLITTLAARVVCRQLGFTPLGGDNDAGWAATNLTIWLGAKPPNGTSVGFPSLYLQGCNGTEKALTQCKDYAYIPMIECGDPPPKDRPAVIWCQQSAFNRTAPANGVNHPEFKLTDSNPGAATAAAQPGAVVAACAALALALLGRKLL